MSLNYFSVAAPSALCSVIAAHMAAASAHLTIQYNLSTTVPSFQSGWHAPPQGRLTSKHAKGILLMCAWARATTKCCSHDCLSAFRNKEMLKKAARWRMQWHKLSRRQRQQVLLDYLRNRRVQQASMKSCLLYTSPSPRDRQKSRMPSSA